MTKPEFMQIYNLLDAVYDLNFSTPKLNIWFETLGNFDLKRLTSAAQRYIETEKYKPRPADLIKLLTEARPQVKNRDSFQCELCAGGFVGVEQMIDVGEGKKEPQVFYYRCKCTNGLANAENVPIITDDIINSRYRDIFGIYRLEPSKLTEIKREDMHKVTQNFGRW